MKLRHLLIALTLATSSALAAMPPKPIQFEGEIVSATDAAITVKGKGATRVYQIYPGTVFGKGNKSKLADFTPGTHVIVIFSNVGGVVKAENIRNPSLDPKPKPKAPAKK